MFITFCSFDSVFLEYSWSWLNDPIIKELTMSPEIDKETQQAWYDSLSTREDYYIYGVSAEGLPIGATGIKGIDRDHAIGEYFGYIGDKEYWGKGIGTQMVFFILEKARELNLKSVWLRVLYDNIAAIKLYEKCGFQFSSTEIINNKTIYIYNIQL